VSSADPALRNGLALRAAPVPQASAGAAKGASGSAKGYLGYVLSHQKDSQILPLVENAVECRTELGPLLSGDRCVVSQSSQSLLRHLLASFDLHD
jgi:hypothetical protein